MYVFNGFTEKANNALNLAIIISQKLGHTCVGTEHILYGLSGVIPISYISYKILR